jgi:hypothetical protein
MTLLILSYTFDRHRLHGAQSLRSCQSLSCSRIFQHFMEPEVSLQCSQEPWIGPYRSLYWSRWIQSILFLLKSILILSYSLRVGLPSGLFLSGFPTKTLHALFLTCYMPCASYLLWRGHSNIIWRLMHQIPSTRILAYFIPERVTQMWRGGSRSLVHVASSTVRRIKFLCASTLLPRTRYFMKSSVFSAYNAV